MDELTIKLQSDDSYLVTENQVAFLLKVDENDSNRIVTVENKDTGESYQLTNDFASKTIISSLNGESVYYGDEVSEETEEGINPATVTSDDSKRQYKLVTQISYCTIKTTTKGIINAINVMSAILSVVGAAKFFCSVIGVLVAVKDAMGEPTSWEKVHGLVITERITKYYRGGKNVPYRTFREILGISTY